MIVFKKLQQDKEMITQLVACRTINFWKTNINTIVIDLNKQQALE